LTTADVYQQLRPLMFAIAYRMLGRVSEAEDIVQEAFLRYHRAQSGPDENADGAARIDSPKAYLSAVTTRLCIDYLRSARARREAYVGEWLPEPLLTGDPQRAGSPLFADHVGADPGGLAEQADSLSMAFLLLLERLSPVERAVFLLRDVFGYDYDEVARVVGKSEDNCRQLALRARRHVGERKPRFEASRSKREELAARFFAAVGQGDMDGLVRMLAEDAVVYGDSGGTRPSWPRPISGRDHVGRLLVGLAQQMRQVGVVIRAAEINGQPGALVLDPAARLINVFALDIAGGQVQTIRSVINPDKLRHLGPLADVDALRRQLRTPGPRPPPSAAAGGAPGPGAAPRGRTAGRRPP
jgi:RNA polymerase sigma-70 factor, ECF subfamily